MKCKDLWKTIYEIGLVITLLTGCGTPAAQLPTPILPTPTTAMTLSPIPSAKPKMEKIWDTNGSPNSFYRPTEVALDLQGNVYIIDGGDCIQKFDTKGNLFQQWGGTGRADGQFDKPLSIALDKQGNIYVTDNGNSRVQKFDPSGKFLSSIGPFSYPVGIAVDAEGFVYIVEIVSAQLQKLRLQSPG